jgi:tetratricopeptide (TPR) repeat protein
LKHSYKSLVLFAIIALLAGCTTQKSRSDRSALAKLYDNTTAKYNGYFNARELLRASILELEQQHEDNYNKILDLYEYVEVDNPQAVAGNLDEAIKKVSVVVALHRESVWTDDCYLLLGQAQYLKQDYEGAEETFRYMLEEFSPSKMKERKEAGKNSKKVSSGKKKTSKKKKKVKRSKKKKQRSAKKKRKQYNRNVKKGKSGNSSGSSKKKKVNPEDRKKKLAEESKKAEEEAEDDGPVGIIRLSDTEEEIMEEKAQKYGIKHRPAYQEGVLWMARTLIERDNYDAAQRYISQLERSPATFKDVRSDLAAVEAYYHLSRKNYDGAIKPLEKAVELAEKRQDKARYTYIMAQIHQASGRGDDAYVAYEKVLKYGPEYEMEFSSKLNMATNAWLNGKGTADDAKGNLAKMLKDDKNEEYQDQIYFAMAQIDLKNGDRPSAIKNFSLSLKTGRQSRTQKSEAYLKLADLFMEDEDYLSAKYYYDSTLQVLASTDERFDRVTKLSRSLTEIAQNLETLELQDSLIRIASLSEDEKKKLAFEIKKQQDEERRKNIANKLNSGQSGNPKNRIAPGQQLRPGAPSALQKESTFFAYDDRKLKRGTRDFTRKWGDRKLEDNWRRSSNRSSNDFEEEEEEVVEVPDVLTDKDIARLLGDVPSSEDEIAAAHLKVREALFALGKLYRERLENYPKSIGSLETLNTRYPSSNLELDSWYYLYLDFKDTNNSTKAQEYYDKILDKYGSSTYALILKDPNYVVKIQDEEKKLNNYYDAAYDAFTKGNFKQAYDKSVSAKNQFGAANTLQPKFALLAAMSTGNLEGKDAYITALKDVIAKYPSTPEQTRAKEILRLLGGGGGAILPGNKKATERGYKVGDNQLHYIIIAFDKDASLTDNKAKVSNYNRKFHKLDKLRISNIYLGTDVRTPIIVIRRFKNKGLAMKYYTGVQKNKKDFLDKGTEFEIFAVTQNNYREILKSKTLEGYREFFEENYK